MTMPNPLGTPALAALALALSITSSGAQSNSADLAAIRAARAQSNRAIAAHDVDRTTGVMAPEYLGLSSRNTRTVGRDAARVDYAQIFGTRAGVVFIRTPREITVNRQWAQAGESGSWTGRWSSADGVVRVGGSYFAKWKETGGQWELIAETFVQLTCAGRSYCDAPPVGPAFDSIATVTLGLSHVFVGVDSATFAAIAASSFLRDEFGAFEIRTTTRRNGASYTGGYLYGRETYVELQQPDGTRVSDLAQLYLGTDRRGDIHLAAERLADRDVRTALGMNTRRRGGEDVPWFYWVGVLPATGDPQEAPHFTISLLEWHRDFMRRWFPSLPADSVGVSRAAYLAPLWKPDRYVRDVVGITFALDSLETEKFSQRVSALGYIVRRTADGVESVGSGLTIDVVPSSPGRHGTRVLRFSLNRRKTGETVYRIGTSELRFGVGLDATWSFK